jgi:peptide/nickel transport system permease protein
MTFLRLSLRNPAAVIGLLLLLAVLFMAASAGFLYPRDPLSLAGRPLLWPLENPRFLLGTDSSGRDIAAQIFHGARISLLIGFVATIVAIVLGIVIGALAGFYGGWIDDVLMRVTEAFQTVPNFLLLLVLVAVFGSNLDTVTLAIGIVAWPAPARLTRAEFLTLRNREFVQACRTLGLRDGAIIFREILPNAMPPLIVYASVVMALAILLTVLAVSLVGQGLNDAHNPRLKAR